MFRCMSTLADIQHEGYSRVAERQLAGAKRAFPYRLTFNRTDVVAFRMKAAEHMSISGIQDKISLKLIRGKLVPTEKDGEYILKPIPSADIPCFKTDVPAPVVSVEPAVLNFALEGGQSADAQLTFENKGLITATNVRVRPNIVAPAVTVDFPFDEIPELRPGQKVTVPFRIGLIHASCHPLDIGVDYRYIAACGIEAEKALPTVKITAGTCFNLPTVGVGGGGPRNAGLLALRILAAADPELRARVAAFQSEIAQASLGDDLALRTSEPEGT